jgi:sulfur carrier protein
LLFSAAIPEAQSFLGMEITINNQLRSIAADSVTVQHILDMEVPKRQKGIAVAVNNVIVPKAEWESYPVLSQDKIVIIKATQGG